MVQRDDLRSLALPPIYRPTHSETNRSEQELGPHCLPVCKNRFKKFARIFSRRHKQTTFSDAGFLGALRVKADFSISSLGFFTCKAWLNRLNSKMQRVY